jgi:hypothetical protein
LGYVEKTTFYVDKLLIYVEKTKIRVEKPISYVDKTERGDLFEN